MTATILKCPCLFVLTICIANSAKSDDNAPTPRAFDSPRLETLAKECAASDPAEKSRLLKTFWKEMQGKAPLVEARDGDKCNSWATFLWRGDDETHRVSMVGGPAATDGGSIKWLANFTGTDLWYRTELMPNDARFIYLFQVNRPEVLPTDPVSRNKLLFDLGKDDPLNPPLPGQIASVLELPGAPAQPWLEKRAGVAAGRLSEEQIIDSKLLRQKRSFKVYEAPHDNTEEEPAWLLIVFDGEFYSIRYPTILDNLKSQKKIPNLAAVFVYQTKERDKELHCSEPFAEFVASELVPTVRRNYRISSDPKHVVIGGASAGGLMAAYCALKHPETFGNVLSMSGAYWWSPEANDEKFTRTTEPGWLTREYVTVPHLPIRFYLSAGRFENGFPVSLLAESWRFRDVLLAKNYSVKYCEYSSGHATLCWYVPFVEGLTYFTGIAARQTQD